MGNVCSSRAVDDEWKTKRYMKYSSNLALNHLKRDEADEILEKAPSGYYLFSQDAAGEKFISVSVGNYVCHHPIFKQGVFLLIDGECFVNINQVLEFYKMHPLGAVRLTKQFTSNVTPTRKFSNSSNSDVQSNTSRSRSSTTTSTTYAVLSQPPPPKVKKNEKSAKKSVVKNTDKTSKEKRKSRKVSFNIEDAVQYTSSQENKIKPAITEENITNEVTEVVSDDKLREKERDKKVESSKIVSEVSSADEKEREREPIPVLPAPTGKRPPPLFQRFSLLESEYFEPFNSKNVVLDPKQMLFQLYKGNPMLDYTLHINTLKVIVTGQSDTYDERRFFVDNHLEELISFTGSQDFNLEYIDVMLEFGKEDVMQNQMSWLYEEINKTISTEIKNCIDEKVPFLLLVYTGHKYGPMMVPQMFLDKHFENLLEIIHEEDKDKLLAGYVKDENLVPCSYVLTEYAKKDSSLKRVLNDVFRRFVSSNEFDEEYWGYFIPGRDSHIRSVLKSSNPFVLFIQRSFIDVEDGEKCYLDDEDAACDANEIVSLWRKSKCFYEHCLLNNNLKGQDNIVDSQTSVETFRNNRRALMQHCQKLSTSLIEKLKTSIIAIRGLINSKSVQDVDYEEVLYHAIASKKILKNSTVHEKMFEKMKNYIKDSTPSCLVVHGQRGCGKSSLLSRASTFAFEHFNGLCCIIARHIGHTPESSSLVLLLKSICIQLSYAYGTDPKAVPNTVENLIDHFQMLLELATDSLPLVVVLDSLDMLEITNHNQVFLMLSNELPSYVRMILSVDSENLEKIKTDYIMELPHPNFTEENAFEYLDLMLVERDRTINAAQKDLVANAISTNHDPIFVRMLMKEISLWRSTTVARISFNTITSFLHCYQQTVSTWLNLEKQPGEKILNSFFYYVTLDHIGITKGILARALQKILQLENLSQAHSLLRKIIKKLDCICGVKYIAGVEVVFVKDYVVFELLSMQPNIGSESVNYFNVLREICKENLPLHVRKCSDTIKQKPMEIFLLYRVILQHGNLKEVKDFFILNFNFLICRLNFCTFSHISDDMNRAKLKYPSDYEINSLSEIIELSKDALHQDPSQFSLQIVSRLDRMQVSTESQSLLLREMLRKANDHCYVLKPNRACLARPKSKAVKDDMRFLFTESLYKCDFIGWSSDKEIIHFYTSSCEIVDTLPFPGLCRVVLCIGDKLIVETTVSKVLFDVKKKECVYTFQMEYDVISSNHKDRIILLHTSVQEVKVFDIKASVGPSASQIDITEVWKFRSDVTFNNICCSDDGTVMLVLIDSTVTTSEQHLQQEQQPEEEKKEYTDANEQILVFDLVNLKQINSIELPTEASFTKTFILSEDGSYFVQMTEPDMNLLVWEVHNGRLAYTIEMNCCRIVKLAVSQKGNCIITLSTDATIQVFNLTNGTLRHTLNECIKSIRMDDQHRISLSADGRFAIYYVKSNFHPSFIAVWDLIDGERLASLLSDYYGLIYKISSDSRYILSNYPCGPVRFQLALTEDIKL